MPPKSHLFYLGFVTLANRQTVVLGLKIHLEEGEEQKEQGGKP